MVSSKNSYWIYLLVLSLLSFAAFWRLLFFDFFQDDLFILWTSLYNFPASINYFLHPGSLLEFYILAHVFGITQMPWFIFAIVLKVVVALLVGTFLKKVTGSSFTGYIGSLFFAVSFVGMYALHAPLNNVPALAAIPLLLALIYFVKALQEKKLYIRNFFWWLFFAICLDPARIIPTFLLLPLFLLLFPTSKNYLYVKKIVFKLLAALVVIGIPLFVIWYIRFASGSQVELFFTGMLHNSHNTISKAKDIGNFFATIANVFTGAVYGMESSKPFLETLYYQRIFGIEGIFIFCIAVVGLLLFLKRKSRFFGITAFFIFWTFLYFLPNFLKEPRAPMASENHYLFLSSIGFVCLVTYLVSFIKKRLVLLLLCICFIAFNIYKANNLLSQLLPYRSAAINGKAWKTIVQTIPKGSPGNIFLFTNNWPWPKVNINPWGGFRYLLLTRDGNISDLPIMTIEIGKIAPLVCLYRNDRTFLTHLYIWQANAPGVLIDQTQQMRLYIQKSCT